MSKPLVRLKVVKGEIVDFLYGQLLSGCFSKPGVVLVIELVLIWAILWCASYILDLINPLLETERACLSLSPDECIWQSPKLLIRALVFAVFIAVFSALSTYRLSSRYLQHSALFSAIFILSIYIVLFGGKLPSLVLAIVLLGVFVLCFWGYRLGLHYKQRKHSKRNL